MPRLAAALLAGAAVNRRAALVWLLVVVVAAAGGGWFLTNFEPRTETEDVGYQGRARNDPWLAAERVLERMGRKVREVNTLAELPAGAILWLPQNRHGITPLLRESVMQWVEKGGLLIVEAEAVNQPDPLLDALSVRRALLDAKGRERRNAVMPDARREPVRIGIPAEAEPVTVRLQRFLDVRSDAAAARFRNSVASVALLLERGKGHVVVLNELDWMSRDALLNYDHAEFLWRLAQLQPDAPEVLFFNNPTRLSLAVWVVSNAWAAAAGVLVLLAAWLWRALVRFGPVAPDPARARRRLLDHLRASGRFLWSHDGAGRLLEAAREACLRRITRAHPDLLSAPDAERGKLLADLLGLDAAQAKLLLAPAATTKMGDFIQSVRLYQTVHERLAMRPPAVPRKKGNS
jgi:hypothetical protein